MKSGTVSVIGRPSAGKSTLVNTITGMKVSITSPVPQTTRNKIRGIYTDQRGQLVFTDTPGYHLSGKEINRRMQEVTISSLTDSDAILYLVDGTRHPGTEEEAVADKIAEVLSRGGRLIYVGAGTSGRLAAVDTVELACTFGFPRERVLTFIAGGLSEAAVEIESNFEEDASCVPEMVLADVTASDVVIGISVSGYAYYVQSALAYAKSKGAYSVLVTESDFAEHPFCDTIVGLCSGRELIAGSTRMKAGTATKKILNFLSTISMLRLGKVYGCYMTELECLNEKLQQRAVHILKILFDLKEEEAIRFLKDYDYKLNDVIERLRKD